MERDPRYRHLVWIVIGTLLIALLCSGVVVGSIYAWLQRELG